MEWSGRAPALPVREAGKGRSRQEHAMSQNLNAAIAVIGIDIGKNSSPLLAVDMIVEVNRAIAERGLSRVGILGTQTVMETRFYGGVTSAEIVPPGGQDLLDVHQAYVTMAASGVATEAQRSVFNVASHRLFKGQRRSGDPAWGD